jgi:hypothetical protein
MYTGQYDDLDKVKEHYMGEGFKLKQEFLSGDYNREEVLTRAERYAGWTLPHIFPDDPLMEYDEMQNDYQSVGAQAVTNLANKIMMALFRPNRPFFRLNLTQEQRADVLEQSGLSTAELDAALSTAERNAMRQLDKMYARTTLNEIVQHLIITGNALMYLPEDNKMTAYSLRDFTLQRDLRGQVVKIIIRETKALVGLSEELQEIALNANYDYSSEVSLYTCIKLMGNGKYIVWQELEDQCYCHKEIGIYKKTDLPWIPLAWNLCRNKDYGTGLVENYSGDFHLLSTFAEAIKDYATVVTDVKNLVDPAGMTDAKTLTEAPSGSYVNGREEDIYVHVANVSNATDFLMGQFDSISRRIGHAFLLNTAVTRDAERVTAEEIRQQTQELEGSLGGVYSRLAIELQLPLATHLLKQIDPIFKDVEPVIVTGLESLSRNSELDQLRGFFNDLLSLSEVPEQVSDRIDYNNLIAILGSGHGVDYSKFLKDEKTVAKEQEIRRQQEAKAAGMEAQAVAVGQETGQAR